MDDPKYIDRMSGRRLVEALEKLAVPSTLTRIADCVIEQTKGDPVEVVKWLRRSLAKGLTHGFIDVLPRKYYLTCNPPWQYRDDAIRITPQKRLRSPGNREAASEQNRNSATHIGPPRKRSKRLKAIAQSQPK